MNAKQFKKVYVNFLNEVAKITRAILEILAIGIFILAVIISVPFIPLIMLGKFIYDKIKRKRE